MPSRTRWWTVSSSRSAGWRHARSRARLREARPRSARSARRELRSRARRSPGRAARIAVAIDGERDAGRGHRGVAVQRPPSPSQPERDGVGPQDGALGEQVDRDHAGDQRGDDRDAGIGSGASAPSARSRRSAWRTISARPSGTTDRPVGRRQRGLLRRTAARRGAEEERADDEVLVPGGMEHAAGVAAHPLDLAQRVLGLTIRLCIAKPPYRKDFATQSQSGDSVPRYNHTTTAPSAAKAAAATKHASQPDSSTSAPPIAVPGAKPISVAVTGQE